MDAQHTELNYNINTRTQNINEGSRLDAYIETSIDNIINKTTQNLDDNDNDNDNDNANANANANDNDTDKNQNQLGTQTLNQTEIQQLSSSSIDVFNNALQQYMRITEECNTLLQALKTRNDAKHKLSETLKNFLAVNKIKTVNLEGSYKGKSIDTITTQSVGGFKRKTVTEALYNELKDEQELFDRIMTIISKTSIIKEKSSIKLINDKKTTTSSSSSTSTRKSSSKKSNILDTADELLNE